MEFAFEHPIWREAKLIPCVLTEQHRQKNNPESGEALDPLLKVLNDIRIGGLSSESLDILASRNVSVETEDHTELFTRNVSVDAYNNDRLNAISGDIFVFEMRGK